MVSAWIVNASPLIFLGRIDALHLLGALAPALLVPEAVISEVRAGEAKDEGAIRAANWARAFAVSDIAVPESVLTWELGSGESQVIAHAKGHDRTVVLDDLAARRCAGANGLDVIGTLGIILLAKRRGIIPAIRPLMTQLRLNGMFAHESLIIEIARLASE